MGQMESVLLPAAAAYTVTVWLVAPLVLLTLAETTEELELFVMLNAPVLLLIVAVPVLPAVNVSVFGLTLIPPEPLLPTVTASVPQ